ncbi:hypothetical protein Pen01_19560 [Phytomonospora endophytica]|nr:hypothetical protein Pen01_19560 [Phytomonospora endophytica]
MTDPTGSAARDLYAALAAVELAKPDVSPGRSLRSETLTVGGKMFAFLYADRLIVKLPADRAAGLIATTGAVPYEAGGRLMKEWVSIPLPEDPEEWRTVLTEAYEHVRAIGLTARGLQRTT